MVSAGDTEILRHKRVDQARIQGEYEPKFGTRAPAADWEPCLEPARHQAEDTDCIVHAHSESSTRWVSRRLWLALVTRRCAEVLRLALEN